MLRGRHIQKSRPTASSGNSPIACTHVPGAWVQAIGEFPELAVGLLFWMWRPRNIVGPLLVAYVPLTNLSDLLVFFPHSVLAATAAVPLGYLWGPLYLWM